MIHHLVVVVGRLVADVPGPNGSSPPPGVAEKFNLLLTWLSWVAAGLAVAGVITGAGVLAWAHTTGRPWHNEGIQKIVWACVGAILIGAATGIIRALAP